MNNPTEPQSETPEHATVIHPDGSWGLLVRQILLSASSRELDTYELMLVALDKERNALRAQVAELTRERNTAFGNGITAGKKEALNYSEDERKAYGMHVEFATLTRELEQLREVIKQVRGWIQSDLNSEDGFLCVRAELQRRVQVLTDAAMSARNEKEAE